MIMQEKNKNDTDLLIRQVVVFISANLKMKIVIAAE